MSVKRKDLHLGDTPRAMRLTSPGLMTLPSRKNRKLLVSPADAFQVVQSCRTARATRPASWLYKSSGQYPLSCSSSTSDLPLPLRLRCRLYARCMQVRQ